jgi:hypothetical protein
MRFPPAQPSPLREAFAGSLTELILVEVRALENVVVLEGRAATKNSRVHLPIDRIRSVWKDPGDKWCMIIEGNLYWRLDSEVIYESRPREPR